MFEEVLLEGLIDTARVVPLLVGMYILLEYISHREVPSLVARFRLAGATGPLAGTILGVIPQCSMSVLMTSLFVSKRVSLGTLLATYLATSDEALPLLIAEGRHAGVIVLFVSLKAVIAIVAGYTADLALGRQYSEATPAGRLIHSHTEAVSFGVILRHGAWHALVIGAWVLLATILLGLSIAMLGGRIDWNGLGAGSTPVRVIAVTLFGMVPNCAASVAITQAFLTAGLPFGTTVAGLSAGAGLGPIVLVREARARQAAIVLGWLAAASILAGLAIDWLYPLSLPLR
jgi:hypothetical protein